MRRGVRRLVLVQLWLLLLLLLAARSSQAGPPGGSLEPDEPNAPAAARQAPGPPPRAAVATARARIFRFDALRIEGLAGPNALVLRQLGHGRRRSLLRLRRSFVHRIFATLDAPLH